MTKKKNLKKHKNHQTQGYMPSERPSPHSGVELIKKVEDMQKTIDLQSGVITSLSDEVYGQFNEESLSTKVRLGLKLLNNRVSHIEDKMLPDSTRPKLSQNQFNTLEQGVKELWKLLSKKVEVMDDKFLSDNFDFNVQCKSLYDGITTLFKSLEPTQFMILLNRIVEESK